MNTILAQDIVNECLAEPIPFTTPIRFIRRGTNGHQIDWQDRCYRQAVLRRYREIVAPTGSGKSKLEQGLALSDRRTQKVIIAYSKLAIGVNFEKTLDFLLPDETEVVRWPALKVQDGDPAGIQRVLDFIMKDLPGRGFENPPPWVLDERLLQCTHLALVLAYARLEEERKTDALAGISLIVDEAHHARTQGDDNHKLGKVVREHIARNHGPVTLVTATPIRADGEILTKTEKALFTPTIRYHWDEYLRDLCHLKNIKWRYVFGDPIECLKAEYQKDKETGVYPLTLVYHPRGLSRPGDTSQKIDLLKRCQQLEAAEGRRWMDFVTDDKQREDRLKHLTETIIPWEQEHGMAHPQAPHTIHALEMLTEGFDYPRAGRAIMLAPRGSFGATIQILGRLMRDWKGKEQADFVVVLPNVNVDGDRLQHYYNTIFTSMLIDWQFKNIDLVPAKLREQVLADLRDVDTEQLGEAVGKAVLKHAGSEAGVNEAIETFVEEMFTDRTPEHKQALQDSLQDVLAKTATRVLNSKRLLQQPEHLPYAFKDLVLEMGNTLAGYMGYADLRDARAAVYSMAVPFQPGQINIWLAAEAKRGTPMPPNLDSTITGDEHARQWRAADTWLQDRGSSLRSLCIQLKILTADFELPVVERWIRSYVKDKNRPPDDRSGQVGYDGETRGWDDVHAWLQTKHGKNLLKMGQRIRREG